MNYLFLKIDSAINKVDYKIGFVASGAYYRKLNNQLSTLVSYKKELDLHHRNIKEINRIERNFTAFCKRNGIVSL